MGEGRKEQGDEINILEKDNNRYNHIDLLKFLAMLFVIVYHGTTVSVDFVEEKGVWQYVHYIMRPLLSVCAPVFFLVNGYLLFNRPLDLKKHVFKTVKLIILTVIWRLITVASLLILVPEERCGYTFQEFGREVLKADQGYISHLWFMGALVCIYICFPLLKSTFDKNRKIFLYFLCVCALLTFGNKAANMFISFIEFLFTGRISGAENINCFNMFNPFREMSGYTLVYFSVGGLLGQLHIDRQKEIMRKYSCTAVFAIIASTLLLAGWGIFRSAATGSLWDIVWNGYDTFFTFVNVLALYLLSLNYRTGVGSKVAGFVRMVSENTLGIYFLHVIILYPTAIYVKDCIWFENVAMNFVYALVVMAISALPAFLLKKIISRRKN